MGMIDPLACIGRPPESRDFRHVIDGFTPFIEDSATIEAFVTVDAGIEGPTYIGHGSWLMKGVHIGHDAVIGSNCEFAPKTVIGGFAVIEDGVRCGIGVLVRPRVRVGAGARLGAGAVVVKDVPPGETWVGNPAKKMEKKPIATGEIFTELEMEGWDALAEAKPQTDMDLWEEQYMRGRE